MSDPNREQPSWFPSDEEIALAYEKDGYEDEDEYPALNRLIERAVLRGQIEAYGDSQHILVSGGTTSGQYHAPDFNKNWCEPCRKIARLRARLAALDGA